MNHKKVFLFLIVMCLFTGCSASAQPDALDKASQQIEQALGEKYTKQSETQVYDVTFSNGQGGDLIYHICLTTYSDAVTDSVTGLDINAVSAVFDVASAAVQKEFDINGHPAVIYLEEDCSYLCCTSSPETSMVLEYDPQILSEEDAVRIMQSVFEPVQS